MDDIAVDTKTSSARKTETKTSSSRKTEIKTESILNLEKTVEALTKKCSDLEKICAKLENKNVSSNNTASSDGLSDERWDSLKLFLEKRFGRGPLKESGVWFK